MHAKLLIESMDAIVTAQNMIYKLSFSITFVGGGGGILILQYETVCFCYRW